jgi:LysR family transcriptional regulator for bpeEF and oprC
MAATEGLGICHIANLLIAEYVERGALRLILQAYSVPGPSISLVYPSAGHQSAKVRVFSDFAADLMRGYTDMVRSSLAAQIGRAARQEDRRRARGQGA